MTEPVLLEKEGTTGWLTLNRPDKRNALSLEVMEAMLAQLHRVAEDTEIRSLVIRGSGPVFCAGHDLKEVNSHAQDLHYLRKIFGTCSELMQYLHTMPQPVIAQVHGIATAAGCQLVAACDLALAESGARFATPGVNIGLFCVTPMVPLVRLIGRRRAMEMLMTGRFVSAEEALQYGLINTVTAPDQLAAETQALAARLAAHSSFTLAFGKQAFYRQIDLDEGAAYNYAREAIAMNCLAEDAREGMQAFLEKRPPNWKGR